jgi:hypothetical protein
MRLLLFGLIGLMLGIAVTVGLILSHNSKPVNPLCTAAAASAYVQSIQQQVNGGTLSYSQGEAADVQRLNYCEGHS